MHSKRNDQSLKGSLQDGKTYLQMYLMRGYYPKYRKNPHNSIAKITKLNKSVNKQAKDLSRHFSKEDKKNG